MDAILRVLRELSKTGVAGWRKGFIQATRGEFKKLETDLYQRRDPRHNYILPEAEQQLCAHAVHRVLVLNPSKAGVMLPYDLIPRVGLYVDSVMKPAAAAAASIGATIAASAAPPMTSGSERVSAMSGPSAAVAMASARPPRSERYSSAGPAPSVVRRFILLLISTLVVVFRVCRSLTHHLSLLYIRTSRY